jgi:hypothetical protein
MSDISGLYDFHDDTCEAATFLFTASPTGSFVAGPYGGGSGVLHGHFDATNNSVSMTNGDSQDAILLTRFYDGYAILNDAGAVCALAGTYHESVLYQRRLTVVRGGWYATWTAPPPGGPGY